MIALDESPADLLQDKIPRKRCRDIHLGIRVVSSQKPCVFDLLHCKPKMIVSNYTILLVSETLLPDLNGSSRVVDIDWLFFCV